jgi:hypothetical protein
MTLAKIEKNRNGADKDKEILLDEMVMLIIIGLADQYTKEIERTDRSLDQLGYKGFRSFLRIWCSCDLGSERLRQPP